MKPSLNIVVGLIVLGAGLLFMLIGGLFLLKSLLLRSKGILTSAKVVDCEIVGDGSRPVVEFTDFNGVVHRVSLSGGEVDRNGMMKIYYHSLNPSFVSCASFGHFWLFPVGFLGLGGMTVILGIVLLAGLVPVR